MQQNQWEVVILKPTSVFLSFLSAQLPGIVLPDLSDVQRNTTAYTIARSDSDEGTLDEIEQLFPVMFKHEIRRLVGDNLRYEIEGSFLDFLCCFKFDLHTQIVLMEPSIHDAHQLLCIKPRSILLKSVQAAYEEESGGFECVADRVEVNHLTENATVVIKNFKELSEVRPFVEHYYRPLFKAEMFRMCDNKEEWPAVDSFEDFKRYFKVEIHTQLIHLH